MFRPFTINLNRDDDDAPMTKAQFKKHNEKLDSLLGSSTSPSSSKFECMLTTYKVIVELLITANAKVLDEATSTIQTSEKTISEMTAKVKKLSQEETDFMAEFKDPLIKIPKPLTR